MLFQRIRQAERLVTELQQASMDIALRGTDFDRATEVVADFADLKSPYTINHSRGVAELAAQAAQDYGLPETDVQAVRLMGYLHDVGRVWSIGRNLEQARSVE